MHTNTRYGESCKTFPTFGANPVKNHERGFNVGTFILSISGFKGFAKSVRKVPTGARKGEVMTDSVIVADSFAIDGGATLRHRVSDDPTANDPNDSTKGRIRTEFRLTPNQTAQFVALIDSARDRKSPNHVESLDALRAGTITLPTNPTGKRGRKVESLLSADAFASLLSDEDEPNSDEPNAD